MIRCAVCGQRLGRGVRPYVAIYRDARDQPVCYKHAHWEQGTIAAEFAAGVRRVNER